MNPTSASMAISGWGRYPVETCHVFRPEKRGEIAAALDAGNQSSYIARGLGRSYGDAALNEYSGVIAQTLLNRFLAFDETRGILECEGGVSLAEIVQHFLPRGWFLPVTPGTKFVTVGGAIAADIHGKNHHKDGSFSNFVLDFRLLTSTGDILLCSSSTNPECFWATVGGMGLTGIILTARIRLRRVDSAWLFVDYHRARDLGDCLDAMNESDDQYDYSVAWIDGLTTGKSMGRGILMRGNHAAAAELKMREPLRIPKTGQRNLFIDLPSGTLNRLTIKTFNSLYYSAHSSREKQLVSFEKFFYPLDSILQWNRMYGKRGFVQYQIALPLAGGPEGLRVILEKLSRSGRASFLAVLKRFGDAGSGLLSFPMRGYTLALDIPAAPGLKPFLHELDRMTLDHGGRVYLAKDATLEAQDFAAMYPRLEEFRAIQRKLDPARKLSSSMARRLRIVERANLTGSMACPQF